MKITETNTESDVIRKLEKEGYSEIFKAEAEAIKCLSLDRKYDPSDLKIVDRFRFEGMSNPSDSSELLALETNDKVKGTLSLSYGAKHSQNVDLIREIPNFDPED